ncbi:unnamed protein product [Mytilus coruscus]|uniref:Reverse transcriptase domain-containing protein n=1 Tax=Mytilus coruscus TaxID=42192 RepID=A0A6J8BTJ8_MYTCO|nr:unnamed protein product [Mytilus coruscus]
MSSLLISEARYEIKKSTENFFISVLGVQSAFDVVQHIILMDKALDQHIHPTYWKILTELYEGLSSNVKWMDGLSEPFKIKQGVRQGGILSTHLYKIFVQDLLVESEQNSLGYHLGDIYVGAPTCADDIAFISNNEYELQIMLNVIDRYAKEHHYKIHPTKTEIIDCSKHKSSYNWTMGGKVVKTTDCSEHLGIRRTDGKEHNFNIKKEYKQLEEQTQVWNLQNQPRLELRKAIIKARMMTGSYILQSDKHKFTHFIAEPLCQLCNTENEDIVHMVTSCPVLITVREKYYVELKREILDSIDPIKWNTFCCNMMEITRLILDCNNFKGTLSISSELITKIEEKGRNLLFQLHAKRIEVLDALNNK